MMVAKAAGATSQAGEARVLIIADNADVYSSALERLEQGGCERHLARSPQDVETLLERGPFDIVLSTRVLQGRSTSNLGSLLWHARSSLYYALGAGEDCLWLPVLKQGRECYGAPALRTGEFLTALDELVRELRASARSQSSLAAKHFLKGTRGGIYAQHAAIAFQRGVPGRLAGGAHKSFGAARNIRGRRSYSTGICRRLDGRG